MTKMEAIQQWLEEHEETALTADGFDDAVIGIVGGHVGRPYRVVYDYEKCVQVLMSRDEMSEEDAFDHMEFNVVDAYAGPETPEFLASAEAILEQAS